MSRYQIHLIDFGDNTVEVRDIDCYDDSEAITKAFRLDFPRCEARFEVWMRERLVYSGRHRHARRV